MNIGKIITNLLDRFWADKISFRRARWNGMLVFRFCFLVICLSKAMMFVCLLIGEVFARRGFYQYILSHSLEDQVVWTAKHGPMIADFNQTLKDLDRKLPLGDTLVLYAPQESVFWREYFEGRARLYLYPRYYGENTLDKDHILIPFDKDYPVIPGYKVCRYFSESTLLSQAGKCLWSQTE